MIAYVSHHVNQTNAPLHTPPSITNLCVFLFDTCLFLLGVSDGCFDLYDRNQGLHLARLVVHHDLLLSEYHLGVCVKRGVREEKG